jgi:hypothetical protein
MDLARILQIYVIQLGAGGIFYFLMAYLILRRDTKRLNQIFAMYFISVAIGTVFNVIYAPLQDEMAVIVLNIITYYFMVFGQIFLLVFCLILLKSEKVVTPKKQALLIVSFAALLALLFPIGLAGGVTVNESWKPVWSLPYLLYSFILCGIFTIIPTYVSSLEIHKKFEDPQLKKKWKYFIFGISFYFLIYFGTSISNFLNDPTFRTVWSLVALVAIISTYLIYYGVGKQI